MWDGILGVDSNAMFARMHTRTSAWWRVIMSHLFSFVRWRKIEKCALAKKIRLYCERSQQMKKNGDRRHPPPRGDLRATYTICVRQSGAIVISVYRLHLLITNKHTKQRYYPCCSHLKWRCCRYRHLDITCNRCCQYLGRPFRRLPVPEPGRTLI